MEMPPIVNATTTNLADGDVAIRYLREQEAIRRARSKRRWITFGAILAGMFVLMVGCGIAVGAAASGGSTTHASAAAPTAATTAPATSGLHEETRVVPAPPTADSAPEGPPPAPASTELPRTWISPGMWLVGPEVEAGTYRSTGPDASGSCYIDAKVGDHYAAQEVSSDGPVRVTVAEGQTVDMSGCLPFTKVG